jgi:hypothetical protein
MDTVREEVKSVALDYVKHTERVSEKLMALDEKMLNEVQMIDEKVDKNHHL